MLNHVTKLSSLPRRLIAGSLPKAALTTKLTAAGCTVPRTLLGLYSELVLDEREQMYDKVKRLVFRHNGS